MVSTERKDFFNVVKSHGNFKKDFFDKLSPKLEELKEGLFFVTGMYDDHTAELILTPDGVVPNMKAKNMTQKRIHMQVQK